MRKTPFWLTMIQSRSQIEWNITSTTRMSWLQSAKKGMDFVKGTSWYKEAEKVYASMLKGIEEDEKKLQ